MGCGFVRAGSPAESLAWCWLREGRSRYVGPNGDLREHGTVVTDNEMDFVDVEFINPLRSAAR